MRPYSIIRFKCWLSNTRTYWRLGFDLRMIGRCLRLYHSYNSWYMYAVITQLYRHVSVMQILCNLRTTESRVCSQYVNWIWHWQYFRELSSSELNLPENKPLLGFCPTTLLHFTLADNFLTMSKTIAIKYLWLRLRVLKGTVVKLAKPFIGREDYRFIFIYENSKSSFFSKIRTRILLYYLIVQRHI